MKRGAPAASLLLAVLLAACGEPTAPPEREGHGVDLDRLFAPATAAEVAAVRAEWATRAPVAVDVVVVEDDTVATARGRIRVRVVSHEVDGLTHYGAILTPDTIDGSLPVGLYAHGGDAGTSVETALITIASATTLPDFVWLVPSFRDEALSFAGASWRSDGPASPWDRDVDDALALIEVALEVESAADPDRRAVLGFSRGGGVAMLMGARDPRIDRIVSFFGPTDFFGPFVRGVVAEALDGTTTDLPGLDVLEERFIGPLGRGELTIEGVRPELVRRSPVLFAEDLPPLQIHHGTDDPIVPVGQAQAMIAAMGAIGRGEPDFEATLYPGGTHNPFTLPGSIDASVRFLSELATVTPRR